MTQDFAKPSTTRQPAKAPRSRKQKSARGQKTEKPKTKITARKPSKKTTTASTPKNGWGFKILLIVLLIGGSTWLVHRLGNVPVSSKQTPKSHSQRQTRQTPPPAAPHYTFYETLPNAKIMPTPETISHYSPKSKDGKSYLSYLQTGSFRKRAEAEAQKARIAFLGIQTSVNKSRSSGGSVWYRVETAPFTSRSKLNGAIDKLVTINIEPMEKRTNQ